MKKSIKTGALLVAGVLALSGCGGSSDAADSGSAESSPTPTLSVGQDQYTADELEAALQAVKADEGLSGQIANDATVRPELKAATAALEQITITPVECHDLALNNFSEKMDSANFAIMQLSATDTVTIMSYEDASFVDTQVKTNEQQMEDCAEFQMEAAGQVSTASAKKIDASTDAVTTQASVVVGTTAGQETEALQINGFSGTIHISVALNGPSDQEGALAAAEELINAILEQLSA